jgi:hypothetical protein
LSKFFTSLALTAPPSFVVETVINELHTLCGAAPVDVQIALPVLQKSQKGFILTVNGIDVVVVLMAEPMPSEAYDVAASGSIVWRDAKATLAANTAHVVVATMLDANSHQEALASAFAVTVVTAAIIRLTNATGVVFNPALTAFPAQDFHDMAVELAQKRMIPEMLWVSLDFIRGEKTASGKPKIGISTTGLLPFIGREIEFMPVAWPPGQVAQRVLSLAQYLILNGPVINNGDTVGNTPSEELQVFYRAEGHWMKSAVLSISAAGEQL